MQANGAAAEGGAAAAHAAAEDAAGAAPAGAAPGQQQQDGWVPDVMRCRWRRAPGQRRLLPRLRANLRAMALSALIIAGGVTSAQCAHSPSAEMGGGCKMCMRVSRYLDSTRTAGQEGFNARWLRTAGAAQPAVKHLRLIAVSLLCRSSVKRVWFSVFWLSRASSESQPPPPLQSRPATACWCPWRWKPARHIRNGARPAACV